MTVGSTRTVGGAADVVVGGVEGGAGGAVGGTAELEDAGLSQRPNASSWESSSSRESSS